MKGEHGKDIRTAGLLIALMALIPSVGCAHRKPVAIWEPQPLVQWNDLAVGPIVPAREEYRLLPMKRAAGLFPAAVAVTRVEVKQTDDPGRTVHLKLTDVPRNEILQWSTALEDQMAVREVFPIAKNDLGGGDADPKRILAAFRALGARLGLIYAVNELSRTESEILGVLYDAIREQPIASFHAKSESVVPSDVVEENKEPIDLWKTDSRALVRAKFESYLHGCVHELIRRDRPVPAVVPAGWTPMPPVRPVEWPPARKQTAP